MAIDWLSYGYAGLVTAGGIIGYVRLGSVHSLPIGFIFGGILGAGAWMTSQNPDNYYLTLGTSALLLGLTGHRYFQHKRFMPMGMIASASLGMLLTLSHRAIIPHLK